MATRNTARRDKMAEETAQRVKNEKIRRNENKTGEKYGAREIRADTIADEYADATTENRADVQAKTMDCTRSPAMEIRRLAC